MRRIEVGRDYLVIDGVPRFLYGGDFSYVRCRREGWRAGMAKIRNAGMNTVSCYVPWLFHEPEEGSWDFAGNHDLGAFIDLAAEFGLFVILRMGPFVHSEYRNGGLPQWLVNRLGNRVRTNDPEYLELTGRFYSRIIEIARPRQLTAGGPIVLLQLENELGSAGCKGDDIARGSTDPGENARHVLHYYNLARSGGLDLPIIDINHVPDKETAMTGFCDSGGGYPVNCFGSDGELWNFKTDWWASHVRPRITIETGSGMFVRYYDTPMYRNTNSCRGPLLEAAVVEAYVEQNIAEGANGVNLFVLFDGYNFHDSAESMLPRANANYQAPVSCVGTLRDSYRAAKRIGWFVRAFEQELLRSQPDADWAKVFSHGTPHPGVNLGGDLFEGYGAEKSMQLAPVVPVEALARVTPGLNLNESNFLFVRNVRHHSAVWRRDVRVSVLARKLACEVSQEYPRRVQMELPPGTSKILPFFVAIRPGAWLEYSTGTLLDRRPFGAQTQLIVHAGSDETIESRIVCRDAETAGSSPDLLLVRESPCALSLIGTPENRIKTATVGGHVRFVLVSTELAGNVWEFADKVAFSDLTVLESTEQTLTVVSDHADYWLEILTPCAGRCREAERSHYDAERGVLSVSGSFELPRIEPVCRRCRNGEDIVIEYDLEPSMLEGLTDLVLDVQFDGTLGEAELDGVLISDHAFGRFREWEIGLAGFLTAPGTLRIVCRDSRTAEVRIRPVATRTLHFDW